MGGWLSLVEQRTLNPPAIGSNPMPPAIADLSAARNRGTFRRSRAATLERSEKTSASRSEARVARAESSAPRCRRRTRGHEGSGYRCCTLRRIIATPRSKNAPIAAPPKRDGLEVCAGEAVRLENCGFFVLPLTSQVGAAGSAMKQ